jgi:hypothetical protein
MKNYLLITSLLFCLSSTALCQSNAIDYWEIYFDNKLLNKFTILSETPQVEIKESELRKSSLLMIKHFSDTYRSKYNVYFIVRDSSLHQFSKIKRSSYAINCTFKLNRLYKIFSQGKVSLFTIYLRIVPDLEEPLFTLTFKK